MVLLTYTLALSNYAHSILGSLPSYEPTPGASNAKMHVSKDDETRIAAGLARAVDLLCQASGVAQWTAENICPKLDGVKKAVGRLGKSKWPIEGGEDAYRGLSMCVATFYSAVLTCRMLLADAHVTAIRKLLLPVLSHSLFSPPGPPLPSNHPSPSLLAKLYLHVSTLYDSSRAVFKVTSAESGSKKLFSKDKDSLDDAVEGDATPELKRYLRKESILAAGLARKWLGVDVGENGKGAKVGEALSWVKDAQSRLQDLEDGTVREKMKGLSFGKGSDKKKEERKARKGRLERELDDISAWVRSYQQMNDTVRLQVNTSRRMLMVGLISTHSSGDQSHNPFWTSNLCGKGLRPSSQQVPFGYPRSGRRRSGRDARRSKDRRGVRRQGQLLLGGFVTMIHLHRLFCFTSALLSTLRNPRLLQIWSGLARLPAAVEAVAIQAAPLRFAVAFLHRAHTPFSWLRLLRPRAAPRQAHGRLPHHTPCRWTSDVMSVREGSFGREASESTGSLQARSLVLGKLPVSMHLCGECQDIRARSV